MRNITVDIVKGLGILSVVLCHNWICYHNRGELSNIVFSVHMPLFVFLAGLFFKPRQSLGEIVTSKSLSLLKPFFVILLVNFSYHALTNPEYPCRLELLNIAYASGGTLSWTPLWFLSHIFLVFVVACCFNKYVMQHFSHVIFKWVLLLLLFWVGANSIDTFADNRLTDSLFGTQTELVRGLPFNLDIVLVTVPIFFAGHLLSEACLNFKPRWNMCVMMLILFVSLHYFYDETLELNGRHFGSFFICTAQIFSGIYLVFTFAFLLQFIPLINKVLQYFGGATLYLLIFHFVPQHIVTGSLQYYFPQHLLICAIIGMVVSILLSLVLWELTLRIPLISKLMLPPFKVKQ